MPAPTRPLRLIKSRRLRLEGSLFMAACVAFSISLLERQLVPIADDLAPIPIALFAVPDRKCDRHRFAGDEFHVVRLLRFQIADEYDVPETVVPHAFAAHVLLRHRLRLERSKTASVRILDRGPMRLR